MLADGRRYAGSTQISALLALTDVEYDIRINWNRIPEKLYREGERFYS
jgi:hypothetical protein